MQKFTRGEKLAVAAFLFVGLIGALVYVNLYDSAFPTASLNLKVTRADALRIAKKYMTSQGYKLSGYEHTVVFGYDAEAKEFLERNIGLRRANPLMSDKLKIWYWSVRWFKPLQEEEFSADVSPSGEVTSFSHTIPEKAKGTSLPHAKARRIAVDFLRRIGLDPARYSVADDSTTKRPNRVDHDFEWEEKGFQVAKAKFRVYVSVAGDRVSDFGYYLKTPESWYRKTEGESGQGDFLMKIAGVFYTILNFAIPIVFLFAVRARSVRWRFILGLVVILTVANIAETINSLPLMVSAYDTTQSMGSFFTQHVLFSIVGVIMSAFGLLLLASSADVMQRWGLPNRTPISRLLTRQGLLSKDFARASLIGFGLGFAQLGYVSAFYVIAMKYFHAWSPADVPYDNTLSTALPWIYPLTIAFSAAVTEELTFRLFAISFIKRYARFTWFAVLLPAMVWAFLHSNYPQHPAYVRGIELSIVGVALGIVFLKYGVIATMASHYTYNAVIGGTLLFRSENFYFRASGIAIAVMALLPLMPALISVLRKNKEVEEDIPPEPVTEEKPTPPPPPPPQPEVVSRVFTPMPPRKLGLIALVGLVSVLVCGVRFSDQWTHENTKCINRKKAAQLAQQYLKGRGVDTRGFISYTTFSDGSGGFDETYIVRHMDPEKAKKLFKSLLHDATWTTYWVKPLNKEKYHVSLDADGRFYSWDHEIKEDAPGPNLPASQARALAEKWLKAEGVDLSQYRLLDSSLTKRDRRTDHYFVWEKLKPKVAGASFRLSISVQGSEVMSLSDYIHVPDEYYREESKRTTRMAVCGGVLGLIMLGLAMSVFVIFVIQFAGRRINWKLAFGLAALFAVVALLGEVNGLPTVFAGYADTDPLYRFILTRLITLVVGIVAGVVSLACFVGLADSLYRRTFPDKPSLTDWYGRAKDNAWRIKALQEAVVVALSLFCLSAAAYSLVDKLEERFFRSIIRAEGLHFSGQMDGLSVILGVFPNSLMGLVIAPLSVALLVSLVRLYIKRPWIVISAVVIVSLLGMGAEVNKWPRFWDAILKSAVAMPAAYFIVTRWLRHNAYSYALLAYFSAVIREGMLLLDVSDRALKANGCVLTALGCIPIAVALCTWFIGRRRRNGPLEAEEPVQSNVHIAVD